jgi:hypothetical protein
MAINHEFRRNPITGALSTISAAVLSWQLNNPERVKAQVDEEAELEREAQP